MKKLIIIFGVILFVSIILTGCVGDKTPKEFAEEKEKGKVKFIKSSVYLAIEKFGETEKGKLCFKLETFYDENGNIIKENSFDASGNLSLKIDRKYNDKGNKIEENSYDAAGTFLVKTKYVENGNKVDTSYYDADGIIMPNHEIINEEERSFSFIELSNISSNWIDLADEGSFLKYITDDEVKKGRYKNKREYLLYKAIGVLMHNIDIQPRFINGYLNLGLAFFKLRKDFEALYYWKNAERLYPNNPYLRNYYQVFANDLKQRGAMAFNRGRMDSAAIAYYKWAILSPGDPEAWYNLGGAFFNTQNWIMAKSSWEKALQINPNYTEVKKVLPMVTPELISISQDNIVISSGIESVKQISDANQIILKDILNKIYNKKKIEINYSVSSYDSEGNWIKKIILINGKSEGLTERKIKYYK